MICQFEFSWKFFHWVGLMHINTHNRMAISNQRTITDLFDNRFLIHSNNTPYYNISNPGFRNDSQHVGNSDDNYKSLLDFILILDEYGVPALLTVGVIANLVLMIVVRNSELKKVAACCYFFAMGIVDNLYLIAMSVPWFSTRVVDIYNTEGFCQLIYYLNVLTTFLSSWFGVMLLLERLFACYRPDTGDKFFSAFRSKCYVTIVSVFSIVAHLYLTWTSGVYTYETTSICIIIPQHWKDIVIMRKIDSVFSFFLPLILHILFTVPLIVYLCASNLKCDDGKLRFRTRKMTFELRLNAKAFTRYTDAPRCSREASFVHMQRQRLRLFSNSKRLTFTSIILSVIYIILFLPHNIIKIPVTFSNWDNGVSVRESIYLKMFEELYKINFAYKPFLYFTLLPEIRRHFIKLLTKYFKRVQRKKPKRQHLETPLWPHKTVFSFCLIKRFRCLNSHIWLGCKLWSGYVYINVVYMKTFIFV